MGKMTIIGVKDGANNDVFFDPLSASAGDKVPALWRLNNDASLPTGMRATIKLSTQDNGPKTARRLIMEATYPIVSTSPSTGQKVVVANVPARLEILLPSNVPSDVVVNAATLFSNVAASLQVKDAIATGYAPVAG